jgi:hypothetical protein
MWQILWINWSLFVCVKGMSGTASCDAGNSDCLLPCVSLQCATVTMAGTSMATPAAASSATIIRQYFTDGYYPTGVWWGG